MRCASHRARFANGRQSRATAPSPSRGRSTPAPRRARVRRRHGRLCAAQVLEHADGSLLDEVEHLLEAVARAVIGIRHFDASNLRRELEQQPHTPAILDGADFEQCRAVELIHR